MENYSVWKLAGHTVEYFNDDHQYLIDGICVQSVTQALKYKFGNKYSNVDPETLKRASERGTEVHEAIENYCRNGIESELPEVRNFKFLQKQYGFTVLENESPVIFFKDDVPMLVGRLDMVVDMNGQTGICDIKRTSVLDKEYLAYQLNMYRIAYRQTYGIDTEFLRAIHLRDDVRKFVPIPINEQMTMDYINELEGK